MKKLGQVILASALVATLSCASAMAKSKVSADKSTPAKTEQSTNGDSATKELQIKVTSAASTVKQGDKATVSVSTAPGANCKITVKLKSGNSTNADLKPVKADATGNASWTWTVAKNTSAGEISYTVQSSLKSKKAEASGKITIEKAGK